MLKNMLTVDLEDWRQSTFDLAGPITENVQKNTRILLELLHKHNTRATFFCLGIVAQKYPQLIKEIKVAGHEIATHGWSHRSVRELGREQFKAELKHSIGLLEDICGEKVLGHRAPDFSIDLTMTWAFEVMREAGLRYDSSIFPIRGKRYGSADCRPEPHLIYSDLMEIPLSMIEILGRRLPVLGGGYFRLYPYFLSAHFVRAINADGRPAVGYIHPYELDADGLAEPDIRWFTRIHQGLFRSRVSGRLEHLIREFEFTSIRSALE